jgi:hypothetical protein
VVRKLAWLLSFGLLLDGKIIARSIAGTFKAKLADEELSGGPFFGSMRGR